MTEKRGCASIKWKSAALLAAVALMMGGGGCRTAVNPSATLYQYSTIQALIEGVYDGEMTLAQLRRYGDFGIGTFNALDGEMILLDGAFFQIRADGRVYQPPLTAKTPFAAVVPFEPLKSWPLPPGLNYTAFQAWLNERVGGDNVPVAVRVRGRFVRVRTRSVPAQSPPYRRLTEVTRNQPEFAMESIEGSLVGFRLPSYLAGVNVAGYHLHFLAADLSAGGHLLDFETQEGTVEIGRARQLRLDLPETASFDAADLKEGKQADVHAVER